MKVLVLDNYDSFTYNLVHILEKIGADDLVVMRNDRMQAEEAQDFDKIVLSPGTGLPGEAGIMKELIRNYSPAKSILGVCLGHQAIAEVFGGRLINLEQVQHGVEGEVRIIVPDEFIFRGIPTPFTGGRYYSWMVEKETLPSELEVTAVDEQGRIMALRHVRYDVRGMQFHPESVMTGCGEAILKNWLEH